MKAMIVGILGQDGSYLAELLMSKGYDVVGIVKPGTDTKRLNWLEKQIPGVSWREVDILNNNEWLVVLGMEQPDEIYNFAGVTNIFDPWADTEQTFLLNARVPQIIMESIWKMNPGIKYFQASSCLIFGKDTSGMQNESTSTCPVLPYGAAKLYADNMVKEFRSTFDMYCCSGIFYNHESPRRGKDFFSKKIVAAAAAKQPIKVGSLSDVKDYGYAPDFMEAVHAMMNNSEPKDYVIGTGRMISMQEFTKKCFDYVGLDYKKYVLVDDSVRKSISKNVLRADITKISKDLNWGPRTSVEEMIALMIDNEGSK